MNYKEIEGNLITLALEGTFDVIAHGCNCHCDMGAGIAPQMAKTFGANKFPKEHPQLSGDINKLGTIDYRILDIYGGIAYLPEEIPIDFFQVKPDNSLVIVNAYTQYGFGANHSDGTQKPLDYEALTLCMRKINKIFKGKHIGLPGFIGAGLAGGDISKIREIIKKELSDCRITIVFLPQNSHIMLEEFR